MADLPELRAGIYRHYKGPLYQVLGYAHDANADTLYDQKGVRRRETHGEMPDPLGERNVVVYLGLELTEAHVGPRLAVRNVSGGDAFFDWLHPDDWTVCPEHVPYGVGNAVECDCPHYPGFTPLVQRFAYVGPSWEGDHG